MVQAAFFCDWPHQVSDVYGQGRRETLEASVGMFPHIVNTNNFEDHLSAIRNVEYIFSTWGMPSLTEQQIDQLNQLKVVFYAAGGVRDFATPYLERGIQVVSAWAANAIPVAEFVVAQIILASKGYFATLRSKNTGEIRSTYPGNFETTVALLGAGMIGRTVITLLKPYNIQVLVFDPFLTSKDAQSLGVTKISLEEAFKRGLVVSNHLADIPETQKMLGGSLFEMLPKWATFINTGRGATVDEQAMLAVLQHRDDLTALLDVTDPEPPRQDSLVHKLDNVIWTPHIAGSFGRELWRMADFVIEEFQRYRKGQPLRYAVSQDQLKTMA